MAIDKNMRVFPVLEDGEDVFDALYSSKDFSFKTLEENKFNGGALGELVTVTELTSLRESIIKLCALYGYPITEIKSADNKLQLDRKLGKLLYEKMNITPSVAATLPLWHFMNLILVPDIVNWRWNGSKDHFISIRRNYLGTQWWRYYLFLGHEDLYNTLPESVLADLYERSSTRGLPNHVIEVVSWIDEMTKGIGNVDRSLYREVLKRYNAELGYRLYFVLSEEDKHTLFINCWNNVSNQKNN
jgi:hypothetical protein